ncbi:MAG: T9SS C-terminal target domain-containing protein [Ignavibacteriae bacterium]|nr:T9SS C-terminal target domain-containing protein [Ignavibacteriota bacterium]
MVIKMNYIKLICVFLFIIQIPNTFSQSNADYFPWQTGDMWEYTLYYWPEIDTLQTIVIDDSVDEAGNIYTTYFSRAINPIEPPPVLLTDTLVYKIDTSLYVYHRYFDFNYGQWINVFRLNGNAGDQWVMWDYSQTGAGPFEMAKIDSIKEVNLFGLNTDLMYLSYFWEYFDGIDTIRLYRYYDQLAKGFGFYFRGGAELDAQIYQHGCVISGELYGDTTQIVTSVDELHDYNYFINDFVLSPNYPNPFNSSTKIPLQLNKEGEVSIAIYDVLGNEIATLVDGFKPVGKYEVKFDASGLASGVYFYQLKVENYIETKKMQLVK